jgi:hypothetical protein
MLLFHFLKIHFNIILPSMPGWTPLYQWLLSERSDACMPCQVNLTTCHVGTEAEHRYRFILSSTSALDCGGWLMSRSSPFTPGNNPLPPVSQAGWATGPVWTGMENLSPTGIRSPDRPVHSQSLHRLCYPVPLNALSDEHFFFSEGIQKLMRRWTNSGKWKIEATVQI